MSKRKSVSDRVCHIAFAILAFCLIADGASGAGIVSYRDKLGRVVQVNAPVKRAVILSTYEIIPMLGVWDSVAGVGRWAYDNDLIKATKTDVRSIPSVGTGTDINMEALFRLNPDIVITWTFRPEQVSFMEKRGLKVITVYPDSIAELYDVLRIHGRLFGKEKIMNSSIARMESMFNMIKSRVGKVPVSGRRKVLWLGTRMTNVSGGVGMTHDTLTMIGAINPASNIKQRNVDVSVEKIIEWNPEVIFIWGGAKYGADDILKNPQWRYVNAVKNRKVYKTPEWSTWSPRIAPVTLWMACKTYPEYFRDVKLDAVIDDFYIKVFRVPYRMVTRIEN